MKSLCLTICPLLVLAGLLTSSTLADAPLRQPLTITPANLDYDAYYSQDVPPASPSDAEETPQAEGQNGCGCGASADCGCTTCCDSGPSHCRLRELLPCGNPCFGSCLPCGNCGDPWKLYEPSCCQWTVGGWINGGIVANTRSYWNNGAVPFLSTNDFLMNQMWGFVERKADTGGSGLDWGIRVDYVFGADGPDTQAFGDEDWDFGWNSGGRDFFFHTYGSAIPQLYAEVAYDDLTCKIGHFYTIIGYEVVQAPGNFFYTHAYTMAYGEPFTHTGILGEYAYSEDTTLYGGYVFGIDPGFENRLDAHTFLGGIRMNWWEDASLAYMLQGGDLGRQVGGGDIYIHSIVLQYQLTDTWQYVLQTDLGIQDPDGVGDDAQWYGLNQYLFYDINSCWKFGARFEWFRDEDGARVQPDEAFNLAGGNFFQLSLGLNYKPDPNVIIRPEIRADWYDPADEATARPFDGGTKKEQFLGAVDFILLF